MGLILFSCVGGNIVLPDRDLVLVDRQDGGNLIVNPPHDVWERSELTPSELTSWSFLVAATGKAMLEVLPQLENGCINYWEAGNWALNERADPNGTKTAKEFRKVHLHLLGRSPLAVSVSWKWGEAPKFPDYVDRYDWASKNLRLTNAECHNVVQKVETILITNYGVASDDVALRFSCSICGYPSVADGPHDRCPEYR